jgi:hypothetical protein
VEPVLDHERCEGDLPILVPNGGHYRRGAFPARKAQTFGYATFGSSRPPTPPVAIRPHCQMQPLQKALKNQPTGHDDEYHR